ncbi:hypothetical protein BV25DRAFT_1917900 [Artomyces pyxidatus]|uniref:Uncharacterized protein n=1 Tax=Artomyces pyxidatus TaxID=48021 RepID=A0ACB8SWS8_9AGAM|nr:hypothetical protein BV25DRAFT_1917900 [Artomyces pyxidatus]
MPNIPSPYCSADTQERSQSLRPLLPPAILAPSPIQPSRLPTSLPPTLRRAPPFGPATPYDGPKAPLTANSHHRPISHSGDPRLCPSSPHIDHSDARATNYLAGAVRRTPRARLPLRRDPLSRAPLRHPPHAFLASAQGLSRTAKQTFNAHTRRIPVQKIARHPVRARAYFPPRPCPFPCPSTAPSPPGASPRRLTNTPRSSVPYGPAARYTAESGRRGQCPEMRDEDAGGPSRQRAQD